MNGVQRISPLSIGFVENVTFHPMRDGFRGLLFENKFIGFENVSDSRQ